MLRGSFEPAATGAPGCFPILKSKGADGQSSLLSTPDEYWIPKVREKVVHRRDRVIHSKTAQILEKAGYLLITAGQDNRTARVTATASDAKYIGNGWMPITGLSPEEAKAVAVFVNSTAGRLQLMQSPGRKLDFPTYSAEEAGNIRIPDVEDEDIRRTLAVCWEQTRDKIVPQFRDGENEVRRLWDEAVADAMGWDADGANSSPPCCCTRSRMCVVWATDNIADEADIEPADHERFNELADRWES